MTGTISGLHHITVISGNAQRNLNFYANVLGLRFIKKTVNFDDPSVYHLYYGDEVGTPGTVLTFFPWEHARRGRRGVGEASLTQFSIPPGSLPFWRERLERAGAPVAGPSAVFGEERLVFEDPDGMKAALVVAADLDQRTPWTTTEIGEESAIHGFHGVTLSLADH
ncbi:MAG: ring-cleaving dioxygenase, partial [Geminicoccaceae bacterium]|nr:ring-cleaving dioxygenase [Geminicoccaceae bacterium]